MPQVEAVRLTEEVTPAEPEEAGMVMLGRDGVGVGSVVLAAERVAPEREGEPREEKEPR